MQIGEPRAQISQRGSLEKLGSRKAKVKKKMKALNGGTTWTRFEASLASRRVHSAIWVLSLTALVEYCLHLVDLFKSVILATSLMTTRSEN